MKAEIIAVGTELLLGEITNTNARFLSQELASLGITVHFQSVVGDNRERLVESLRAALGRSDVVITTGGLGPTADDLTKETICRALGRELILDQEQLEILRRKISRMSCSMTQNQEKQVMFPKNAVILPNDQGTAPGCVLRGGKQLIIMLPGPPFEMEPMFTNYVRPVLEECSNTVIRSRRLEFFGIGEAALETKLKRLMESENPTVAPYAKLGQVSVRVTASAPSAAECDAMCRTMIDKIRDTAAEYLYGYDDITMEETVAEQLELQELTAATAEFGTGGVLSRRLASCAGGRFASGFVETTRDGLTDLLGVDHRILKKEGACSPGTAARMAVAAARMGRAHIGISACLDTEGEEKEKGTAYVGVSGFGRVYVKELDLAGQYTAERMRQVAATHACDLARRLLDEKLNDTLDGLCVFRQELKWNEKNTVVAATDPSDSGHGRPKGILMVLAALAVLAVFAGYMFINLLKPAPQEGSSAPSSQSAPSLEESGLSESYSAYLEKVGSAYEKNGDVVGYLTCDGYETPLVQGEDNEYYLTHDLLGDGGAIPFVDSRSDRGGANKNTVIYARSGEGDPFSFLQQYTDPVYCSQHPTITVGNSTTETTYRIVSVFYGCINDEYGKNFPYWDYIEGGSEEENEAFAKELLRRSLVNMGVDVNGSDTFVTLHTNFTAFYGGRLAVVARAVRPGEELPTAAPAVTAAEDPLMPPSWYVVKDLDVPEETGAYTRIQ